MWTHPFVVVQAEKFGDDTLFVLSPVDDKKLATWLVNCWRRRLAMEK